MMRTGKIKGALLAFVLALVAACGVACGGTTSDAKIVITGTPENGVVTLTDSVNTLQLGYELSEGKGDVVWRSGDEEIATVDDSGKVTLIDSGAVVITATLDKTDVKADALLTVKDERAVTDTITLSGMPETNTVQYEEGSLQLSAVCSNASATLVWTSSDETVATVNDSGLISFVGGGTTDITVYKKGQRAVRATASLTVIRKVEAVTIGDVNSGKVIAGYDYRLKQPYEYALQTEYSPWNASAFELEWSVDDAAIAEIDQNGVLTGKESGNVTVTAQVKGSEIKATKEFEVVKLDDTVEDFSLAVANRFIIGEICVDGWTDYTGAKVTSHNAGIFIDEYDSDKHMLTVEKNTNFMHWSHVCFGCWELAAGKYQFTIELEVTRGEFAGVICGAVYGDSKAEYEGGIRADGKDGYGTLSECKKEGNTYTVEFELTQPQSNFGIMLYDYASVGQYEFNVKSFSLAVTDFAVDTDIYSDGKLVMGEEYKFVPGAIDGCEFEYAITDNGTVGNEIIELKDGKIIPKKVGEGVKLTVSTTLNGKPLKKEYELSVMANPFKENEDDYTYATDVTQRGDFYDVKRTSVFTRTLNWSVEVVDGEAEGTKSLKFVKAYAPSWEGSVMFFLGDVKKGAYTVSFTLRGDIGKWGTFNGFIYPLAFGENYKADCDDFTRGMEYGNIYDEHAVHVDGTNVYSYTIIVPEDTERFGVELRGVTAGVDYTLYLDAFKFAALADIESAVIDGIEDNTEINSGETKELSATVTWEGASQGQSYGCAWSVSAEQDGGSARIIDGENGEKLLQGLKPGAITLTLTVTSATGKQITVTKDLVVELGGLDIETNMYADRILVKGEDYTFDPIPLMDGMEFTYAYKEQDGVTDANGIIEIKNGRLYAKAAGTVKLIVSSEIDGTPVSETFEITVKEYGGTIDANYNDATVVNGHEVKRTNVYIHTGSKITTKVVANGANKSLEFSHPADWAQDIVFALGNVAAGEYKVTFVMRGDILASSAWNAGFTGHLYGAKLADGWKANFGYTKATKEYVILSASDQVTPVVKDGVYTYTVRITVTEEQKNNFALALCSNLATPTAWTVCLDAFKFEKLPAIDSAEINSVGTNNTVSSGTKTELGATVGFADGATVGETYTAAWSVATKDGGTARIEQKDGKSVLVALKPGKVTLTLTVTGASGKVITKTLDITIERGELTVNTDMYDNLLLVKGESYTFVPEKFEDTSTFTYKFGENGDQDTSAVLSIAEGKITALAVGTEKVTVTETSTGMSKVFEITVKEYGGTVDENYNDATVVNGHEVKRTNVYIHTGSVITTEVVANGANKSLQFSHPADWAQDIVFALGNVAAGEYEVTFVMRGEILASSAWNAGFTGHLYAAKLANDWKANFGYTKENKELYILSASDSVTPIIKDGVYTYTMRITVKEEQKDNFALALCSNLATPTAWTVYLDAFKFEQLPVVSDATIDVDLTENTMQTGENVELAANVTYENAATKGETFTVTWSVQNGTGTARIEDGNLIAVAPGAVTLKLHVESASGVTIDKSVTITIEVGEIAINTDIYSDNLLVKGEEYSFVPQKFTDESNFEFTYSVNDIVKVENGKLIALAVGTVTVTVTETVTKATKSFDLAVKECGGTVDENFNDATVVNGHEVKRTNVYIHTGSVITTEVVANGANKSLQFSHPADWAQDIVFALGNVAAGEYEVTFVMRGEILASSAWNAGFTGHLYAAKLANDWKANFGYTKESNELYILSASDSVTPDIKDGVYTYTVRITVTETQKDNFALALRSNLGSPAAWTVCLDAFKFERIIPIETDMWSDGVLIKGEEYTFVPSFDEGSTFTYTFANGNASSSVVSIADGKLTANAVGSETITVTEVASGATRTVSVEVREGVGDRNYKGVTVTPKENNYSDITGEQLNCFIRTQTMTVTNNDGVLNFSGEASWDHHVYMHLGNIAAGTYEFQIAITGIKWEGFSGCMYWGSWAEDYQTNYAGGYIDPQGDKGLKDENNANVNLCDKTPVNGVYTVRVTVTDAMANEHFGLSFGFGTSAGVSGVNLSSFRFTKVSS